VTEKEAMYAVQRLAARERKCDKGRAEREAAVRKAQEAGERPRQAAGRGAQSVKGESVNVRQVIVAAKAETVERVAKAEATTVKQPAATGQVTPAIKGETARQDPAKAGPERLGLAGLKAAAQRRRLAASTS
jgi:hypothetical protein